MHRERVSELVPPHFGVVISLGESLWAFFQLAANAHNSPCAAPPFQKLAWFIVFSLTLIPSQLQSAFCWLSAGQE